ncbi:MAG TPA: hypothetical protein VNA26_04970 [Chitinophagaceae bacterium]|nr:hypothetical protein [Chitinophagaceae bacterium]
MKCLKSLITFCFLTIFVSCISNEDNKPKEDRLTSENASDTKNPETVVHNFLKWYKNNDVRLNSIPLIKGGAPDTTTFYSVDFTQTEKYLSELKKSGFLSDKYLNDLRTYFKSSNDSLKKYPQNDGPAYGFDFDFIMQSQDYMDIMENIDSLKILSKKISGNSATIIIDRLPKMKMAYGLSKQGNTWLIDTFGYKSD